MVLTDLCVTDRPMSLLSVWGELLCMATSMEKHYRVICQMRQWGNETESEKHQKTMGAGIQASMCYWDSLSSRLGLAGIVYGAEAGTGPGVWPDSSGDRNTESSRLFPQPLIWMAANTLFFLPALQRHRATKNYLKFSYTAVHFMSVGAGKP